VYAVDSGFEPSLDSGVDVGRVSGPGVSPCMGVYQISLVSSKATYSAAMDATMVMSTEPSLGYGAVVGRVMVPEVFPGLRSSGAILGTLSGPVHWYS